jgi:hypothetical protein
VEKILFIHSSLGVYYHHYPFFLSKLTKEGKVSKRGKALRGKANTTQTSFVCKKESHAVMASTMAAITPPVVDRHASCRIDASAGSARLQPCLQKERNANVASETAIAFCIR